MGIMETSRLFSGVLSSSELYLELALVALTSVAEVLVWSVVHGGDSESNGGDVHGDGVAVTMFSARSKREEGLSAPDQAVRT